uniref:Uncharacterized protein n=1 Tax=Picea glauca TaxID=3330 RepID=A0A101M203_PICGL|nr:hypothetical protein ABT39_MTgene3974 [Picea glauca]
MGRFFTLCPLFGNQKWFTCHWVMGFVTEITPLTWRRLFSLDRIGSHQQSKGMGCSRFRIYCKSMLKRNNYVMHILHHL